MNQRYAGFWVRFFALLIDGLVLIVVILIIIALSSFIGFLTGTMFGRSGAMIASFIVILGQILSWGLVIGYSVVYQAKYRQTLGKKAMNIKVITYDGKTPTMLTFFLREVIGKFVSGLILDLGYLMVAWDAKKQGLHDKIANTYVVYVEPAGGPQQTVPVQQQQP